LLGVLAHDSVTIAALGASIAAFPIAGGMADGI